MGLIYTNVTFQGNIPLLPVESSGQFLCCRAQGMMDCSTQVIAVPGAVAPPEGGIFCYQCGRRA